jgi:hypothetical protein
MVVPLAARAVAAVVGGLLVVGVGASVVGSLIVPRFVTSRLTSRVHSLVHAAFRMGASRISDYVRRDRILVTEAATVLLTQLTAWMGIALVGYALLLWPFVSGGLTKAFTVAGSSLLTLGFAAPRGSAPVAIVCAAAATGLVIITLQIAYLPTLYAAFNRRETEVALLSARAGVPSWGPELLARTHYALGSGVSTLDALPELYTQWERWASDVRESHTSYLPLVRFRSPRPYGSWVTALLAMLDSAALYLTLCPSSAPVVPARLFLRAGFLCFNQVAEAMGLQVPDEVDQGARITLSYDEFLRGVDKMREVDFPLERDPSDAWGDFVGWRANYEQAAYAVAAAVDAVPALWSGPRRGEVTPIAPVRPPLGRPPK